MSDGGSDGAPDKPKTKGYQGEQIELLRSINEHLAAITRILMNIQKGGWE